MTFTFLTGDMRITGSRLINETVLIDKALGAVPGV